MPTLLFCLVLTNYNSQFYSHEEVVFYVWGVVDARQLQVNLNAHSKRNISTAEHCRRRLRPECDINFN